jgi:hypothetical protein
MNPDLLELNLPTGAPLPPPPPAARDALQAWQDENLANFYQSPHYEAWLARTSEEMRDAEPFVM